MTMRPEQADRLRRKRDRNRADAAFMARFGAPPGTVKRWPRETGAVLHRDRDAGPPRSPNDRKPSAASARRIDENL
jgi:hypothetical protein